MPYPKKGDKVVDRMERKERHGVVTGQTYGQNETYIKCRFDDTPDHYGDEEFDYEEFFTQRNCGCGRWDENLNAWVMEIDRRDVDHSPEAKTFITNFNKAAEQFNKKTLMSKLGLDWNLNLIQLEILAIENELEAEFLGCRSQYYNWYMYKAEDYRKAIDYKIREV